MSILFFEKVNKKERLSHKGLYTQTAVIFSLIISITAEIEPFIFETAY
jgi:hypothetical protein